MSLTVRPGNADSTFFARKSRTCKRWLITTEMIGARVRKEKHKQSQQRIRDSEGRFLLVVGTSWVVAGGAWAGEA